MATYNPNGRNVTRPDENRPSWRPQDQDRSERTRSFDDDDRGWRSRGEDRFERSSDRDPGDRGRWGNARDQRGNWEDQRHMTERYGQGQSGYGSGRYSEDRSYQNRNQSWYGRDDRDRGMGTDERFERGRGGADFGNERGMDRGGMDRGYNPERYGAQGGYGGGRGFEDRSGSQQHDFDRTDRGMGMRGGMDRGYGGGPQGFRGGGSMGAQYDQPGRRGRQDEDMQGGGYGMQRGYGQQRTEQPRHRGKGPQGYTRSDDRIKECVCDALTDDNDVDATHIEVVVKNGEVILTGTVEDRETKRCAEDIAERQPGVKDVQNQLRVGDRNQRGNQTSSSTVSKNETETSFSGQDKDKKARA